MRSKNKPFNSTLTVFGMKRFLSSAPDRLGNVIDNIEVVTLIIRGFVE
ncbi:hypothetical protein AQPE_2128 [Aquipluma nitroreducens]|uniref:Uncharacterized protein n=1 Tax=Aquipluma nitroreducens TaxID=2010828 RepID=A0A5K7S922_9BACT|nr:hypothetical protein AQPE_2128 [Aquipluma nitroreducens]